jgi:hypothetical protein
MLLASLFPAYAVSLPMLSALMNTLSSFIPSSEPSKLAGEPELYAYLGALSYQQRRTFGAQRAYHRSVSSEHPEGDPGILKYELDIEITLTESVFAHLESLRLSNAQIDLGRLIEVRKMMYDAWSPVRATFAELGYTTPESIVGVADVQLRRAGDAIEEWRHVEGEEEKVEKQVLNELLLAKMMLGRIEKIEEGNERDESEDYMRARYEGLVYEANKVKLGKSNKGV